MDGDEIDITYFPHVAVGGGGGGGGPPPNGPPPGGFPILLPDSAAPFGETPRDLSQAPWVSRCRERTPLVLMQHPTHTTLREWTGDMISKAVTCSDRIDNWVMPWLMRSKCMEVTFEELGIAPNPFVKLDRILLESIKSALTKKSEVYRWILHEDHQRLEKRLKPLTSCQMLRKLYLSFSTNNTLSRLFPQERHQQDQMAGRWSPDTSLHEVC